MTRVLQKASILALLLTGLTGLVGATPAAWAAQIAGVTLPLSENVQGQQLQLTACAAREELWMELYALSLYMPLGTATVASRILDDDTPKLLRLDVTYGGQVPSGLPEDWTQRLREQVSREFMRILQNQYNNLKSGDTVRIAYIPGQGTTLTVNDQVVVTRPGSELMNSMLGMWTGPDPISNNMKRLLLLGLC
jgi:hypothetical protein